MDDTTFSPPRSESPGYYVPAADASTQTTDEDFILLEPTRDASTQTTEEDFILLKPTRDASTQTTEDDFDLLAQFQSGRNVATVNLESAVDISETLFSGFHEYRNNCDVVKTDVGDVSSSMRVTTDFDMSSGSKNHVEFSELYMQPAIFENILHFSLQSTQHEDNNIAPIQSTQTVNYPAVHMECRASNNNVCGINEAPRNENVDTFHHQGPEVSNIYAESCIPVAFPGNIAQYSLQSIQHRSNTNTLIQGTHPADFPIVSLQSNHSSRQHKEENGSRNACAQGTQLLRPSVLNSTKKIFTCEKCGRSFIREFYFKAHIMSNCDPNPFKCDVCGLGFPFQRRLSIHYRIHGEKSFKCNKCYYATYKEAYLKRHFNRIHKK